MEIPRHVAIIMDGNGRWATARGMPRYRGHQVGVDSARAVIKQAANMGIEVLTLFAFSGDNFGRSREERDFIMTLLNRYLIKERVELKKNNVCFRIIGVTQDLPPKTRRLLEETRQFLQSGTGLILNVALNYLGRTEISTACQHIARRVVAGEIEIEDISTQTINAHLQTSDLPDPDLLIRTSGEQRISNFLLWQLAYTEFYFTAEMWPQFREESLVQAIQAYQQRERRYGLEGKQTLQKSYGAL